MAKNDQGMKEIELEGYRAGLAGESRSNHRIFPAGSPLIH